MAFRHFNNQKSTIGNHQSKGFWNSMQSAWRATLDQYPYHALFEKPVQLATGRISAGWTVPVPGFRFFVFVVQACQAGLGVVPRLSAVGP
jgi:hypothetical protein